MALDALTNSTVVEPAASRPRAAFCMPVIVVAHQGSDDSLRLQMRFLDVHQSGVMCTSSRHRTPPRIRGGTACHVVHEVLGRLAWSLRGLP